MKYQIKVPPSSTEQTVEITVPDLPTTPAYVITGTTPIQPPVQPPIEPPVIPPVEPPVNTGYKEIYRADFSSNADLDPFNHNQYGNGRIEGGRFHALPASVSNGIRSEIQYNVPQTPLEGAVEYEVEFLKAFRDNGHSVQWHPSTNGGSASPGLWHIDGKFVMVNWKGGENVRYPTGVSIAENKKYQIRIEYKLATKGYIRMFVDGVKVLDKVDIQVGDGAPNPWFKLGINMWNQAATAGDAFYDNLVIYQKVA